MDPTMMAGAGLQVVGGGMKAIAALDANKATNQANRKRVEAQEAINKWRMEEWAKQFGGMGASVFLPRYADDEEQQMFGEGMDIYNATYNDPVEQRKKYEAAVQMYMPFLQRQIGDIMTGQTEQDRLNYLNPVAEARMEAASVGEQAMRQAIEERQAALEAQQRSGGYGWSGAAAQKQLLGNTFGALQEAARQRAEAEVMNAQAVQQVRDAELERRITSASSMPQIAQSMISAEQMPTQALASDYGTRVAMFNPYHVQRGKAPINLAVPEFQPEISNSSAVLSSLGSSLSNTDAGGVAALFTGKPGSEATA